jgi:hypothetical protein
VVSAVRVVFVAGLVGSIAWLVKVALIWGNGGTNTDEGLVAVCYLIGFVGLVVACAAGGAWLTAGRPTWLRAVASIGGVVAFFVMFNLLDLLLSPLTSGGHWFQDEVEILVAATITLALAIVARPRRTDSAGVTKA